MSRADFKTLTEALKYWAETQPSKPCLIEAESGRVCGYGELWAWAVAFANRLAEAGLRRGGHVVVRVGGLLETNAAMFGAFLAGGVYCPVEQHLPEAKARDLLREYDAKILVTAEPFDFDGTAIPLSETISESRKRPGTPGKWELPDPGAEAVIVFTTGSTGKAKGVVHTHRTHMRCPHGWVEEWGVGGRDVFLSVQPLERAGGVFHHYSAILAGGTAAHHGGVVFASRVYDAIGRHGVTAAYFQAPALQMLMNAGGASFAGLTKNLRILGLGGTAIPEALKEDLVRALPGTDLYVLYAATESMWMSHYRFNDRLGKANCVGRAAPGNELAVVDENGEALAETSTSRTGIAAVRSGDHFLRYHKADELTSLAKKGDWLLMTDVGYLDAEGYLYIMGRRDDVIVTGGYKVAPYEIEEAAMQWRGITECACIGVPARMLGQAPKLFVKMRADAVFSARELADFLKLRLESFKLPRQIVEVDDFPRIGETPKIDRRRLADCE